MHKIRLICGFIVGLILIHASLLAQQESDDISVTTKYSPSIAMLILR
jgi:hypothetical protein